MSYLIVSDSHGDRLILQDLADFYRGKVERMFHCGDSELPANDPIWQDFITVRGNCDYDGGFQTVQICRTTADTILLTHGHLQNVKMGLVSLNQLAQQVQANVVLFGHTHELGVTLEKDRLFLNPGSIRLPRGRFRIQTYALLETTPEAYTVTYYDRAHRPVPELKFILTRQAAKN